MVFLVKSIFNPLSYSLATFATTGATVFQIFPLFWRAVGILENIYLKVIAATANGASPNRNFFRMHKPLDGNAGEDVVYRTKNIRTEDKRFLYFFADVPHLNKTTRNCLSNSGANRATPCMWNSGGGGGGVILWTHVTQLYHEDADLDLKMLNKLTSDYINLTPYSVMRVSLAAQVLSETVATVMSNFGSPDSAGTAKFISMIGKFFDCSNVRNCKEHLEKMKPFLKPYDSVDDQRFDWLKNLLVYFDQWNKSIEERPGNFSQNAKSRMLISWQTYEGLQISAHSFVEVCKFLLQIGVHYVFLKDSVKMILKTILAVSVLLAVVETSPLSEMLDIMPTP